MELLEVQARYNIALIGKTGVGKSGLINYLVGRDVAKTSRCRAETRGFLEYDFVINDLPATLFDSEGLEVGKSQQWLASLQQELELRTPDSSPEEWFHTILYCINAGGSRVEDFETKVMRNLHDQKYNVILVLVKADMVSKSEVDELSRVVWEDVDQNTRVVSVCSVEQTKLDGSITRPFGKDILIAQIYNNFWDGISGRLPERCISRLHKRVDAWVTEQKRYVEEKLRVWNVLKIGKVLEARADNFLNRLADESSPDSVKKSIEEEIDRTVRIYLAIAKRLSLSAEDFGPLTKIDFPSIQTGLSVTMKALLAVLAVALLPNLLWPWVKVLQKKDAAAALDDFGEKVKHELADFEPVIKEHLEDLQRQASIAEGHALESV